MRKLIVTLPPNRDVEGTVRLEEDGRLLAGPFPVCGLADSAAAQRHGNPARNPLLPFGDTPTGFYRVVGLLASGFGTALPRKYFGPHSVLVLQPTGGDAVLADANGRFHTLIQGGKEGPGKRLLPTNGSLRLRDKDQKRLLRALGPKANLECECEVRTWAVRGKPVAKSIDYELGDPLSGNAREALRKLIVASVFVIGASYNLMHSLTPSVFQYVAVAYRGYLADEMEKRLGKSKSNLCSPGGEGNPFFMAGGSSGDGYNGPVPGPGPSGNNWVPPDNINNPQEQLDQTATSSEDAVNSITDEEAKEKSGLGFDTANTTPPPVDLRGVVEDQDNPQQQWANDNAPVSPSDVSSFDNSSTTVPVQVAPASEPIGPAPPPDTDNAVYVPWDASQKQLPSIQLFTPPPVPSHYTQAPPEPPPLSKDQIDALNHQQQLEDDWNKRPQWLKDLDNTSANAVQQVSSSVPPSVQKAIVNAMPMHDVIADSFSLGGKLYENTHGSSDQVKAAYNTLWSKEGGALLLDMTKEVATHSIGDEATAAVNSTTGAAYLRLKLGSWAQKKVTEKAGEEVADQYWETMSKNLKKIGNSIRPGTFTEEEEAKDEKALSNWNENFPDFTKIKNKLQGKGDSTEGQ